MNEVYKNILGENVIQNLQDFSFDDTGDMANDIKKFEHVKR